VLEFSVLKLQLETNVLKKRNLLPPLNYLVAFESAATLESFAAAARDLNISETAISRKVRLLELHFNCPLFVRGHRSISLTPQGNLFLQEIRPALEQLIDASQNVYSVQGQNVVTLAATNSVAALWLMQRLQKFNRSNRQIKIMLVASDRDEICLAENVDLAILRGEGNWPGYNAKFLFGECVFPVCSPEYQKKNKNFGSLDSLLGHRLIEVSNEHTEWLNWQTWLEHMGVQDLELVQPITVNTYPLAIQAAQDGLGIGLGWKYLVDHLLNSGQLVQPFGSQSVKTQSGYYLLIPQNRKSFPERNVVEQWLLQLRPDNSVAQTAMT
jgi:LysR family glycine cleavage system transcriptional activator